MNDYGNVLQVFNHTLLDRNQVSGEFKWHEVKNNIDYLARPFAYDSHNCKRIGEPRGVKGIAKKCIYHSLLD